MDELFRLKIVGKRQITLPQRMLAVLGLDEGDELQVEVHNGQIKSVRPYKLVPKDLFTPDMLQKLDERERELETKGRKTVDIAELEEDKAAEAATPRGSNVETSYEGD